MNNNYERVYEKMCIGCEYEIQCHQNCENCDEFMEELERLEQIDEEEAKKIYEEISNIKENE